MELIKAVTIDRGQAVRRHNDTERRNPGHRVGEALHLAFNTGNLKGSLKVPL